MNRVVGSVCIGLISFATIEAIFNLLARHFWPDYAAAFPTRSYTLPMLCARLVAGAVGIFCAGLMTAMVAKEQKPAVWFGAAMLTLSVAWHIRIWAEYPVWYHLAWFACLLPMAALGGRLWSQDIRSQ